MYGPSSPAAGRSTRYPTEPPARATPIRHSFERLRMDPHGEQPHLPGPSVYPVGFAIGVACLLVGIIISWVVAAVGAGIAIVFAFLWIRDVAGRRGLTEVDTAPETAEPSTPLEDPGLKPQPGGLIQDSQAKERRSGDNVVRLIPVVGTSGFGCPCHGGAYDNEGNRTAGPPVRSMDRYSYLIKNGHLLLGKTFSVANVEGSGKDALIKKYKLSTPGEHVDGIESWMYPIQPPR